MTQPVGRNVVLGQPSVGERELEAVRAVFESGWLSGAGPTCVAFEQDFARATGTAHALATSNCGSALHLALQVLGAGPGDEVVVADYTFPATGHSVVWTGAKPVFADVRRDIGTIDPASVEALLTERTVGVIAVDLVGQPADYAELRAITDKHGLWLLEDAACSAGADYQGRPAGSLADLATFSFHGRKGITSGEGGALVGDDEAMMTRARKLHTYGIAPAVSREGSSLAVPSFDDAGFNYRMSDVHAAIMRVQLQRMPELLAARTAAARGYAERLDGVDGISLPVALADRTHPWQSYLAHHRRERRPRRRGRRAARAGGRQQLRHLRQPRAARLRLHRGVPQLEVPLRAPACAADAQQPGRRRPRLRRRPAARGAQVPRGPHCA